MSVIKTIYTTSSGIDTRRFQLSNTNQISPYHQIQTLLTSTYGQQIYGLKYTDDDGDVCSIGSDLELNEAFRVYTGKVLKLEVTVLSSISSSGINSSSADLTDDVISLDGSIESDFDEDRIPSPIPSDVFDPSLIQSQATSQVDSIIYLEHDDTESSVSTYHPPSNIIPVDAFDVLPPVEAEAPVETSAVEPPPPVPVVKPTEPLPSSSDADVITPVPQLPSTIIDLITDMVQQVAITPVEDVKTEPVIEPVAEPLTGVTDVTPVTPAGEVVTIPKLEHLSESQLMSLFEDTNKCVIEAKAKQAAAATSTTSTTTATGVDGMTQSMTETKYDIPDEKHGTEWACYACTFVNDRLAPSCTMCGSPKMTMTWTNNGISTIIPPRPIEEKSSIMSGVMNFAREARDAVKDVIKAITPERSAPATAPASVPAPVVLPTATPLVDTPVSVPAVPVPAPAPMPSVPIAVTVSTPAVSAPVLPRVTSAPATFIHHGIRCDGCGLSPLAGTRYKCTVCPDYDLCDKCESNGMHNPDHTMIKMRAPVPTSPIDVRTIHRPISMPYRTYPHVPTHLGLPPHLGGGCDLGSTNGYPHHPYPMPMPMPMPPMPQPIPRITRTPRRPRAEFIPSTSTDGFIVELGSIESVHKIWSLRNSGITNWPYGAAFVHISGKLVPHMNDGSESIVTNLPECAPGAIVHIACDIAVPQSIGKYRGHYRLMTIDRERFGPKIWVCIEVVEKKIVSEEKKEVAEPITESTPSSIAPILTTPAIVTPPIEEPKFVSISTPAPLEQKSSSLPPFEYAVELERLNEMGFTDVEVCKYLLLNNKGDFQKVCEWLIQEAK